MMTGYEGLLLDLGVFWGFPFGPLVSGLFSLLPPKGCQPLPRSHSCTFRLHHHICTQMSAGMSSPALVGQLGYYGIQCRVTSPQTLGFFAFQAQDKKVKVSVGYPSIRQIQQVAILFVAGNLLEQAQGLVLLSVVGPKNKKLHLQTARAVT